MRLDSDGICFCEICNGITEKEFICDTCELNYCDDCSYTFTLHYQFQGSRCYQCADRKWVESKI